MKVRYPTLMAMLMATVLGAYVGAPAFSADQSYSSPGAQAPAETQSPMAQPGEKAPASKPDVCARLDANHDGYITKKEFKQSKKPSKVFTTADITHRGKLNMEECSKALQG